MVEAAHGPLDRDARIAEERQPKMIQENSFLYHGSNIEPYLSQGLGPDSFACSLG